MSKHNFTAAVAPALFGYLGRAGIVLVDVGGRGAAVGQVTSIAAVSRYVTCEPDADEARRLAEALPADQPWRGVTVVPEGIGSRAGTATLYLTSQAGMSSLLEPNPDVIRHLCLREKYRVEGTATVPIRPLDEAAAVHGFSDACFLKIDTQGTELEILQSGDRLVRGPIVGVHVECSFREIYKGQPLFGDVDAYLRARGFALFTMNRVNLRRAGYRPQFYSKRLTAWAHCLYLREPDGLAPADLPLALPRLLALALSFQQFDLAFELVGRIERAGLLAGAELKAVADDVDRVIDWDSDYLIRKAERRALGEDILGAAFRDRQTFE
jgi:FkbM family methyltransferase